MASMKPSAAGVDLGDLHNQDSTTQTVVENPHHAASFAEYLYWADLKRAEEDADTTVIHSEGFGKLFAMFKKSPSSSEVATTSPTMEDKKRLHNEKGAVVTESNAAEYDEYYGLDEHDREILTARRVLRQAGWATVFYLITCDILGPFNAPYSIASIGMAPGICLYVLFGAFAFLGGVMIQRIWLRLDSPRYPLSMYGDMCERCVGPWLKWISCLLQVTQLTINVGLICLTNGQSLSQVIAGPNGNGHLCFSVCVLIWALCGMCIGMIRGLGKFSILANASVWMNLLIIFISIGFAARTLPNYAAAYASSGLLPGPVVVAATLPGQSLFVQVNGVFNMVFAYGGAMVFPEILSEMRRPRDFVKGMAIAQLLIVSVYLMYGIVLYALQGQFVQAQSYTGLSLYSGQTICNILGIITGTIAAGLYGNIGLKVLYRIFVEGVFKGPGLMTAKGRITWSILVVIYWSTAFIVASAIPSVGALTGLLAAMGFFHFTYSFPPLMMLGLDLRVDAALADEPFTTPGVKPRQIDSWKQLSRWKRAFTAGGSKRLVYKLLNVLYLLTALATGSLGLWATGTDLRDALSAGAATSLGCAAPV